jgi:hypothetical protein
MSDEDLVFPFLRAKGTKPPAANRLFADYRRVAPRRRESWLRSGRLDFRRTLASVLVKSQDESGSEVGAANAPVMKGPLTAALYNPSPARLIIADLAE